MESFAKLSSPDLVRACAASCDERAWAEFIRRFHVVIAAAALRTARLWQEPSKAQLDDLVQDTYLKLCESNSRLLTSFQPQREDSIYGFLKVVTANVVHDHFKSESAGKRGARQTDPFPQPVEIDQRMADTRVFDLATQRLQLDQIDRILILVTASKNAKDQKRKRTIFWLRHRIGLTASEIASIPSVGLTTEGVESVLLRLATMIRSHILGSAPHREVKVLNRQNRSKRVGG